MIRPTELTLALLVASTLALTVPVAATDDPTAGGYRIVSPVTGKCVALARSSSANGVNVHQWQCRNVHNVDNLLWKLRWLPGDRYRLQVKTSGKCLALARARHSDRNGVNIHQWQCRGARDPSYLTWKILE
jgi:hypothetical protein